MEFCHVSAQCSVTLTEAPRGQGKHHHHFYVTVSQLRFKGLWGVAQIFPGIHTETQYGTDPPPCRWVLGTDLVQGLLRSSVPDTPRGTVVW